MVYTVPEGAPLRYERTDSMGITVQALGMGSMAMRVDQAMTLGVDFEPSAGGVRVTTTVERLAARMTNPVLGQATLSEADVQGELVFTVDGRGNVDLLDPPTVSSEGGPLFNPTSLGYDMLPKLPPPGVVPGGSWVDTTTYASRDATGSLDVTWAGTSTLMGDTVVEGRRLTLVRTRAEVAIEVAGTVGGMDVEQRMVGPETGFYLWDPARRTLVEQQIDRDLSGTVRVAAVPSPMDLSAKQRKTMKLVDG